MPRLTITILHLLPTSEALAKMQNLMHVVQYNENRIKNVSQKWNGNEGEFTLTFKGSVVVGEIRIQQNLVSLTAQLPFALYFFRGRISSVIEQKAAKLLSDSSSSV